MRTKLVMEETEVRVESKGVGLYGTLTKPPSQKCVVIFVHGSGPLDRNENGKGMALNVFNTLAHALAEIDVASIRYDKRGCGKSGGKYNTLHQDDMVDDLKAWILFAEENNLGPVFLCGHSEGTVIAPLAAQEQDISGIILICPYVTPAEDILKMQAEHAERALDSLTGVMGFLSRGLARIFGRPKYMQEKMIRKVKASNGAFVRVGLAWVEANWMRDFLARDNEAVHRANKFPTLVIAAEHDIQCPPGDAAKIGEMNSLAEVRMINSLSHLLRHTEEPGFLDYKRQLKVEMDNRVTTTIVDWVKAKL